MSKQVLNITNETEAEDLVVLDKAQLLVIRNMADSIKDQVELLRDLMKAAGIPSYSFDKDNTVRAYRTQLADVVKRSIEQG